MLNYKKIKENIVHPTAIIDWKNVILGKNNIIGPYVVIGNHANTLNKKVLGKLQLVIIIRLMNIVMCIYQQNYL